MARLSRFVAVAVLLGGATVSLSSCTGGSDPIASSSPAVSTVVTPSPSVAASPTPLTDEELLALIPENARAENFVSASNFAKFFVNEYDTMFQKPDDEMFRYMSGVDCAFCASSLGTYADLVSAGGHRTGGVITTSPDLPQGGLNQDGYWYVGLGFDVTASSDLDASGADVDAGPGGTATAYVKLQRLDDRWVVQGVSIEFHNVE